MISMGSDAYRVVASYGQEAKRGKAGGQRIPWHGEAIGLLLPPGGATGLSLSTRRMAVLYTFVKPVPLRPMSSRKSLGADVPEHLSHCCHAGGPLYGQPARGACV